MNKESSKCSKLNKIFGDAHICQIQYEFSKYIPLCNESKCDECPLTIGDGICLKNTFEKKWELQSKVQDQEKVLEIIKSKKYIPLDKINPRFWNDRGVYDEMVNYEYYLWLCKNECEYVVTEERKLTRDEFDSLKEMLK